MMRQDTTQLPFNLGHKPDHTDSFITVYVRTGLWFTRHPLCREMFVYQTTRLITHWLIKNKQSFQKLFNHSLSVVLICRSLDIATKQQL